MDYDEDLTDNKWYNTLCEKHQDLFLRATNERWMICIPRIGSWKSSIEDGDLFSQKSFESHILKPVMFYTSDGAQSQSEQDNKYVTYNGKEIIIRGSKILCIKGFSYNFNQPSYDKRNENLVLNVESCHTSTILFEETFFNQNDESYPVLCISEPLEPHLVVSKKDTDSSTHDSEEAETTHEAYGSYIFKRAHHPNRVRQQVNEKLSQFVLHPLIHDETFSDELIDKEVKSVVEIVLNFLSSCLHVILRDNKLRKLSENIPEKNAMKVSIEEYIMHGIHRSVGRKLNNLFASRDSALNKITRNLSTITLSDLGIKDVFWSSVPRARRELSRINHYRLAKDKITCLQNAILCLSSKPRVVYSDASPVTTPVDEKSFGKDDVAMTSCSGNTAMSTDDLLPILVYLIIKCDVPNWLSNLYYLKHFYFTKSVADTSSSFCITTLEAALEHVRNGNVQVNKFGSFKKQFSQDELDEFFSALKSGSVDLVKRFLRQAEAMRSLQEHDKCHPLCECSKCQLLSQRKATGGSRKEISVTCRDEKGRTPLHIAALSGKHELVETLISLDSDLNSSDYHGETPLHLASQEGNQSAIFLLLHHGANPNAEDNNNNTSLHLACLGGHEGCVKALLFYDPVSTVVKVNASNDVGDTPLHVASKWGYVSVVTCLMEYGADPHQTNRRKITPLNICRTTRVSRALRNTEPTNVSTNVYRTPQNEKNPDHTVTSKPNVKKPSRSHTVKPNSTSEKDVATKQVEKLLRAVSDDDINMVSFVCGWDEQPKADHDKCHPLCQCFKCQPPVQDVCLHANSSDGEGNTPLTIAAKQGYYEMVKLLLKHGAKTNVKTKAKGHSPLHLAAQYGHKKIVETLLEAKASCDLRDTDGSTPIYMCAMNGHSDSAELLLQAGASINLRNHRGDSPLHVAVRWKHGATACLLIERGALAYYENNNGLTATDLAKQDKEMTQLLKIALETHDIFKSDRILAKKHATLTNHISPQPLLHKSLSQSEADEQLAADVFDGLQRLNAPRTPPMVDVMFENSLFDPKETDSQNNSFLEALSDNPPHGHTENCSDVAERKQERAPIVEESNASEVATQSLTICDSATDSMGVSSELDTDSLQTSQSNSSPSLHSSNGTFLHELTPHENKNETEHSDNALAKPEQSTDTNGSKQRGPYFEIIPKLSNLPDDVEREPDERIAVESPQIDNHAVFLANENLLKQDSEYLSFKGLDGAGLNDARLYWNI